MKSLKIIQTLCRIAQILSFIIFVASIIGAAGCIIGEISIAAVSNTLHQYKFGDVPVSTMYIAMAVGFILSMGEVFIAKYAELYFKHELEAKTPFTYEGSKEMARLGIIIISVTLGTTIIASITQAIMQAVMKDNNHLNLWSTTSSIGLGITFVIISILIKCGVDTINNKVVIENKETKIEE